ncbi:MAG TPA: glutamate 5-kinase [Coriobacteriia bacterium]|nr:glutamate 5-kinase [Coriobacteriia bacterium]
MAVHEKRGRESSMHRKRVIIKIGSSTLTDETGKVDADYIDDVASQVSQLWQQGFEVVIVTSAAITAGLEALSLPTARPNSIPMLQAAAAVGQLELSKVYSHALAKHKLAVGQILLTRFEIENRTTYLHARDTIEQLLELGVVPLINENDTVAVDEIRFGDNDTLAAQVAILIKADLVILLSDIDGLYTADPRIDEDAKLLESIGSFTEEIIASAGLAGSNRGSGGMVTKIEAARMLMAASIPMIICEGHVPDVIVDTALGKQIGTRFASSDNGHRYGARQLWLALSGSVKGTVFIDDGAVRALREQGGSLLAVGVKRVEGGFEAGQAWDIRSLENSLIGRGICGYSSDELMLAAGKRTSEIGDNKLLGHLAGTEVIHRDQMVVF